jgi:hypothetical protein
MKPAEGNFSVDERTERLICRVLDREASHAEGVELERILANDQAARDLFDTYRRNDVIAVTALRAELAGAKLAVAGGRRRGSKSRRGGLWLATACAIGAAAAVIAFSVVPSVLQPTTVRTEYAARPDSPSPKFIPAAPFGAEPRMVDYAGFDDSPHRRQRDVVRDLIGVRGDDKNVIYIYETNTQSTRLVPVSGRF